MVMRIDCHTHGDPAVYRGDPRSYVDECRARGIEAIVLIEPPERCIEAVERFGDFVIPVARPDMNRATAAEIGRLLDGGARGIKFIRPETPYGSERYWPLYEALEEAGAPAVFHTGYLGFRSREPSPVKMEDMRAAQVEVIARRFPDLRILMAHFSNPWWEEAWKVSWSHANVYADLSGGTAIRRATRMWAETFAPDGEILEGSVRKLCFGSDVRYFVEGQYPFEPYQRFYDRLYERTGVGAELRELVDRGNVRSLFGLG